MISEKRFFNHIYVKQVAANAIDFGIAFGSALLGGYFGAMMAALVIVLHKVSAEATQKAIWSGMLFGFIFWGVVASWVNRVLVQGMSRATVGKKILELEIVSTGAPITWEVMMRHWLSVSFVGDIQVVSTLDTSKMAPVYALHSKPGMVAKVPSASDESSDKKAA